MAVKCILTGQTPSVLDGVTENVQTQIDAKAADNAVVHLTGNETISGTKTFTGGVVMKGGVEVELVEITADSIGAASKEYVDSIVTGTTLSVTLASASWTGTAAPYTYTISNSAITATSTQELMPATDITADQLTALQNANIIDGGQAAGSMTLKAFGEKPSVDIPVRIIVKG